MPYLTSDFITRNKKFRKRKNLVEKKYVTFNTYIKQKRRELKHKIIKEDNQ